MGAAVEDVHHRHREDVRVVARGAVELGDVGVERHARVGRGGAGDRERDAEDRVGAEPRLVRRPVELAQRLVDRRLVGGARAGERLRDRVVDVADRRRHALAAPALAAVAKLGRLELAGRCAGRDRGAAERAAVEPDVDLDRRVAPRVEDLPCVDLFDRAHERRESRCRSGPARRPKGSDPFRL